MLILSCMLLLPLGETPAERLQRAAELQDRGDHAAAAAIYDQLASLHPQAGEFYLNQGNAHLLAGHLPQAILAYERAQWKMPFDARLRANLADARGQVIDSPGVRPHWHSHHLALGLYACGWLTLGFWIARPSRVLITYAASLMLISAVLFACLEYCKWDAEEHPFGVITEELVLRRGNGASYASVEANGQPLMLHPGVEARVLETRSNGWLQIELASGVVGWAPRGQVLLDHEPLKSPPPR